MPTKGKKQYCGAMKKYTVENIKQCQQQFQQFRKLRIFNYFFIPI